MSELAKAIARRRQERQADKAVLKPQGRVVSSYYGAEDLRKLILIAESEGVAIGGIQHEATVQYIEQHFGDGKKEPLSKDPTSPSSVAASAGALKELAKLVEKQWKPGRLPDPHFIFGHPEEGQEEKS